MPPNILGLNLLVEKLVDDIWNDELGNLLLSEDKLIRDFAHIVSNHIDKYEDWILSEGYLGDRKTDIGYVSATVTSDVMEWKFDDFFSLCYKFGYELNFKLVDKQRVDSR